MLYLSKNRPERRLSNKNRPHRTHRKKEKFLRTSLFYSKPFPFSTDKINKE